MARYRQQLPQLSDDIFITDGGLETTLVFHDGLELPHFAAFDVLRQPDGAQRMRAYFKRYIDLAKKHGVGIILESPTWRASADWGRLLGYSPRELAEANRKSIALLAEMRDALETRQSRIVISGCLGPRGDGYNPSELLSPREAEAYHAEQIETFSETEADMVCAITMTHADEAIGIVRAATRTGMPVAVSFTVETDGRLPTGHSIKEAVEITDAATDSAPVYYMINCAHPTHFQDALATSEPWVERIYGIRANASTCSHAELDAADELDDGDPAALGEQYQELRKRLNSLNVLGGCCGTDHRHIAAICSACV
jgi:S-methylmethionine-dependent homocysteine/selenocysteine methylase